MDASCSSSEGMGSEMSKFTRLYFKGLKKTAFPGTSLMVQWIRLRAPNAGAAGSIPGQETQSHMRATTKELASCN